MIQMNPVAAAAPTAAAGHASASAGKVRDTAVQFEGMLLEQMLKSAREAGSEGWLGTGDDQAGESMTELAEQQFAQALSAGGGLGIAKMVMSAVNPAGDSHGYLKS